MIYIFIFYIGFTSGFMTGFTSGFMSGFMSGFKRGGIGVVAYGIDEDGVDGKLRVSHTFGVGDEPFLHERLSGAHKGGFRHARRGTDDGSGAAHRALPAVAVGLVEEEEIEGCFRH